MASKCDYATKSELFRTSTPNSIMTELVSLTLVLNDRLNMWIRVVGVIKGQILCESPIEKILQGCKKKSCLCDVIYK